MNIPAGGDRGEDFRRRFLPQGGFPPAFGSDTIAAVPAVRRIADFIPAALVYAAISLLSHQSSFPVDEPFSGFDMLAHAAEYTALGFALALGFSRRAPAARNGGRFLRASAVPWAIGTGLGFLDELHQVFVPGRNPDLADAAADALGIALGIGLFGILRRRRSRV